MFTQFRALIPNAQAIPTLGSSGYCNIAKSGTIGTHSCLFVAQGQTFILALHVPTAEDSTKLHAAFQTFAIELAGRVDARPRSS